MAPSNPYTPTYLPTATATAPNLSSVTFSALQVHKRGGGRGVRSENEIS